jgi:hypothetical protein
VVFSFLESNSSRYLNAQLDNNSYDETSLITIKLPVNDLPYYTNSPIFERVKGNVTIGGMQYEYVERRIFNDSLEMRCIPNAQATHLTNARDEFFKLVNDLQQTSSSGKQHPVKQTVPLKNLLTEYIELESITGFQPIFSEKTLSYNQFLDYLPERSQSPAEQPPDVMIFS